MARYGRAASKNPLPLFDGPIPSRKEFVYERVVFMPSKDMRPLLIHRANIYRSVKFRAFTFDNKPG